MGTRYITEVVHKKEVKIAQYGQWDGYLEGAGKIIADILNKYDVRALRKAVGRLKEQDRKGEYSIDKYPHMNRDVGANILELIIEDKSIDTVWKEKREEDGNYDCWQEYVYTINLDKKTVSVNGSLDYSIDEWKSKGFIDTLATSMKIEDSLYELSFKRDKKNPYLFENDEFLLTIDLKSK